MLSCHAPLAFLVSMLLSPLRFGGGGTSVVVSLTISGSGILLFV